MGSIKLKPKAIKVVCNNCFRITTGYRDENGVIKYQCTRCGATSVSKVMGRRHVQLDICACRTRTVRRRYVKTIQFNTELRRLMVGLKQRQCKAIG